MKTLWLSLIDNLPDSSSVILIFFSENRIGDIGSSFIGWPLCKLLFACHSQARHPISVSVSIYIPLTSPTPFQPHLVSPFILATSSASSRLKKVVLSEGLRLLLSHEPRRFQGLTVACESIVSLFVPLILYHQVAIAVRKEAAAHQLTLLAPVLPLPLSVAQQQAALIFTPLS